MRATLRDVTRHPSRFADWWLDLPWRKRPLRNLRVLLFTPGLGWLRWGMGEYSWVEVVEPELGGPTLYATCAPPLRRAWLWVWTRVAWMLRGGGWVRIPDRGWERLTWREYVVTRADLEYERDPEWPWGYL